MKLCELFRTTCELRWKGLKSEEGLCSNGEAVVEILGRDLEVAEISSKHATAIRKACRAKGNSPATINRKLSALGAMLEMAVEAEVIEEVPKLKKEREAEGRTRVLLPAEEELILRRLRDPYLSLITFLLYTGARCSEALLLDWANVSHGTVTLVRTKGRRSRTLPLPPKAKAALESRRSNLGGPWHGVSQSQPNKAWDKALEEAGLAHEEELVPHALRHTCATRLVNAGVHIVTVQQWLGHVNIQTTLRYAHHDVSRLALAAEALAG